MSRGYNNRRKRTRRIIHAVRGLTPQSTGTFTDFHSALDELIKAEYTPPNPYYLITPEEMEWRRQLDEDLRLAEEISKDLTFMQAELLLLLDATRSFLEDEPWETINAPPTFGRLDTDETSS